MSPLANEVIGRSRVGFVVSDQDFTLLCLVGYNKWESWNLLLFKQILKKKIFYKR